MTEDKRKKKESEFWSSSNPKFFVKGDIIGISKQDIGHFHCHKDSLVEICHREISMKAVDYGNEKLHET